MDVLLDLNIILDLLIKHRKKHAVAREIYLIIKKYRRMIWLSASSIDNLKYIVRQQAKFYNIDRYLLDSELNKFINAASIFTVSGKSIRDNLSSEDIEDRVIYTNYKRIIPDGIVISNDESFLKMSDVILPEEFIKNHSTTQQVNNSTPKTIPVLDLKAEYRYMIEDIDHAVLNAVAETRYILGPQVKELEDKVANYLSVKHCIGVSSGTDAIVLSLRALAIKTKGEEYFNREDEIITTPFTFTATGDAILRSGATPVFVDIDPSTYNIDTNEIKKYLSSSSGSNVVGIVPVHLYGQGCDMDEINKIANDKNLFVVEDVAQAFGGCWNGKKLGSMGTLGAFSFFPSKNLGGFGDGGLISTKDEELSKLVRMLFKHGGKDKYNVDHIGYNARLDTLQAAVILAKFNYIDEFNEKRRKIAETYNKGLQNIKNIITPQTLPDAHHVYHQYTIRTVDRDNQQKSLKEKGISTMIYYPVPLHKMKVFDGRCKTGSLNNAENAAKEVLSLPIEPLQSDEVTQKVIDVIIEAQG